MGAFVLGLARWRAVAMGSRANGKKSVMDENRFYKSGWDSCCKQAWVLKKLLRLAAEI
jgi:hypothetical protein